MGGQGGCGGGGGATWATAEACPCAGALCTPSMDCRGRHSHSAIFLMKIKCLAVLNGGLLTHLTVALGAENHF